MEDTSKFQIFETDEFISKLDGLPRRRGKAIRAKLLSHIYPQVEKQPFYGANIRKLRGFRADVWRYRIGDYRIFYTVDEGNRVVSMVTIEDRKYAYR